MRLFVAISLPDDVRTILRELVNEIRIEDDPVRWIPPSNIHLTLKFLGEVDPSLLDPVIDAIERRVSGHSPFELTLGELGAFPDFRRPRVIWVGIVGQMSLPRVAAIHRDLNDGLEQIGFEREGRRYTPHLTIGRVKRERGKERFRSLSMEDRFKGVTIEERVIPVRTIELIESILKPSGAEYHVKSSIPLQGSNSQGKQVQE